MVDYIKSMLDRLEEQTIKETHLFSGFPSSEIDRARIRVDMAIANGHELSTSTKRPTAYIDVDGFEKQLEWFHLEVTVDMENVHGSDPVTVMNIFSHKVNKAQAGLREVIEHKIKCSPLLTSDQAALIYWLPKLHREFYGDFDSYNGGFGTLNDLKGYDLKYAVRGWTSKLGGSSKGSIVRDIEHHIELSIDFAVVKIN